MSVFKSAWPQLNNKINSYPFLQFANFIIYSLTHIFNTLPQHIDIETFVWLIGTEYLFQYNLRADKVWKNQGLSMYKKK
jgi:hypothetical protein